MLPRRSSTGVDSSGRYISSSRLHDRSRISLMRSLQLRRFALVGDERAPQRQPALAGLGARLDLRADARRPVAVDVAQQRPAPCPWAMAWSVAAMLQRIADRESARRPSARSSRPLGDLRRPSATCGILAQQREIGLDDQLPGALAAQAPAVDGPGSRRAPSWQLRTGVGGSRRSMALHPARRSASSNDRPIEFAHARPAFEVGEGFERISTIFLRVEVRHAPTAPA